MAQKVAEQVVDMLVDTGVKRIYAVTGDSLNEIKMSLVKDSSVVLDSTDLPTRPDGLEDLNI